MSNEYQQEFRNPISNEFAAEAFGNKKSGFKPISAIFEIIDNSIEAKCNEIQIKIDWTEHTGTRTFRKAKNIIFIDDNPVEREKVRQNLPAIKVLELPDDPADYGKALLDCPYFEQVRINGEDKRRSRQYSNKRLMEKERMNHVSPEEFLASLQPSLYIEGLSAINISRAVQLVTKTNQFNTTTIRYTRTELDELTKSGRSVYVLGLEDRFTEQENIGVGVIHWNNRTKSATIESFLLSCRVLERGIETGFLAWIYEQCKIQKIDKLVGHIVKTPRNIPPQKLYKEHGFSFDSVNKIWTLDLTMGSSIKKPVWLATEEVTTIHE